MIASLEACTSSKTTREVARGKIDLPVEELDSCLDRAQIMKR
jgi:hypothetical protein